MSQAAQAAVLLFMKLKEFQAVVEKQKDNEAAQIQLANDAKGQQELIAAITSFLIDHQLAFQQIQNLLESKVKYIEVYGLLVFIRNSRLLVKKFFCQ
jgi:hypothetical protein